MIFEFIIGWWLLMGVVSNILIELYLRSISDFREGESLVSKLLLSLIILLGGPLILFVLVGDMHKYCKGE